MNMVERVAEVIRDAFEQDRPIDGICRHVAKAAIAAMREPNAGIVAMFKTLLADERGNPVETESAVYEWQSMIDEALKDG